VDPYSGERVDCSSLVDEATNQALHDKAQEIYSSRKERKAAGLSVGRPAVVEFREECRRGWLSSMRDARLSSLPIPTAPGNERIVLSPMCMDEGVAVADPKAQELRWVYVDPHCRANDLTPSEQAMRFLQVEQARGDSEID
jgi:hypothetical protein